MNLSSAIKVLNIPPVGNPFFIRLCDELEKIGCAVSKDTREFWQPTSRYDILHLHFPEYLCESNTTRSKEKHLICVKSYTDQLKYFRKAGTKIVWTAHNLKSHNPRYHNIDKKIFSGTVDHCHGIILQADSGRHLLLDRHPGSQAKMLAVIHHGNYIDSYPDTVSRTEARRKLHISDDDIVFLCFGLIRSYKNLDLLVKGFNAAKRKNKKIKLFLVGQPFSIRTKINVRLLPLLNSRILTVPKFIAEEDVQYYFKAADIGIFAYKDIFMSGGVILAESFGLPVIVPRSGCLPDYVTASTGFFYDPKKSFKDLADKINMAAESDLKNMGQKAREFQLSNDWSTIAKQTRQFYSTL
ncbi:MAG: glycosyltransferase family 4 protein [Candidatus Neomarinimicrobiota bacterium]